MSDFRVVNEVCEPIKSDWAVGKTTGSLYVRYVGTNSWMVVVAKNGLRLGDVYPLAADEILPVGKQIVITV